jgi:phosphoribosylformylglycinamidine (FGAM) synthase PurS component
MNQMKLSTLFLATLVATTAPLVFAQTSAAENAATAPQTTFGVYQIQPAFVAVTADQNNGRQVVEQLGSVQVIAHQASAAASTTVQTNTVVRNVMTGELAVVTGRISVLNSDSAAVKAVANRLGLKQLHSFNKGKVLVLQANANADLLVVTEQLKTVSGVSKVKIDVLENKQEAH